jgi:hypothetical protein
MVFRRLKQRFQKKKKAKKKATGGFTPAPKEQLDRSRRQTSAPKKQIEEAKKKNRSRARGGSTPLPTRETSAAGSAPPSRERSGAIQSTAPAAPGPRGFAARGTFAEAGQRLGETTFGQNVLGGTAPSDRPLFGTEDSPLTETTFDESGNIVSGGSPTIGEVGIVSATGFTPAFGSFQTTAKGSAFLKANQEVEAFGEAWMAGGKSTDRVTDAAGGVWKFTLTEGGVTPKVNTRTFAIAENGLLSYAQTLKRPSAVLGIIGAYAFSVNMAVNEKGDALQSYGIAARDAESVGDYETVAEIKEIVDDLNDPTLVNMLKLIAPFGINYGFSAIEKAKSTKLTLDKANARGEKAEENQTLLNPEYGTEQWWSKKSMEDDIKEKERQEQWQANFDAEQDAWDEHQLDTKERDDRLQLLVEEDREYWAEQDRIAEERKAADRAYWDAKEARDIARDIAEKAYWEEVRKEKGDSASSKLGFGLL